MNFLLRIHNYIQRYAPSEKKLRKYLSMKNYTNNISTLLYEIHFDESVMCELWINSFIHSHKWEREIREKLLKKQFSPAVIDEKMEEHFLEIHAWENHKNELEIIINNLLNKGKSRKYISQSLAHKFPYFREELDHLISSKWDTPWLEREFGRYMRKYDISNRSEKEKIISNLYRKGFRYSDILSFIKKYEDI